MCVKTHTFVRRAVFVGRFVGSFFFVRRRLRRKLRRGDSSGGFVGGFVGGFAGFLVGPGIFVYLPTAPKKKILRGTRTSIKLPDGTLHGNAIKNASRVRPSDQNS